jgi:hypothetical protein
MFQEKGNHRSTAHPLYIRLESFFFFGFFRHLSCIESRKEALLGHLCGKQGIQLDCKVQKIPIVIGLSINTTQMQGQHALLNCPP